MIQMCNVYHLKRQDGWKKYTEIANEFVIKIKHTIYSIKSNKLTYDLVKMLLDDICV